MSWHRLPLAVLLLLAALSACATPADEPGSTSPGGAAPPSVFQAGVVSVQNTATGIDLSVTVQAGASGCAGEVSADVTTEADRVYVTLAYESTATGAACGDLEEREISLDIPDLAGKILILNNIEWGADGAGGLAECMPPFGCQAPPADHCAPAWIEYIFSTVEVAPDHSYEVKACDGEWLVLDLDLVPQGCAPPDGATTPPGCAGTASAVRWFAQFIDETAVWDIIASGAEAGCAPVSGVPAFPQELCATLPAL